jgi:hypothetical protein
MAEPKLEHNERLDKLDATLDRMERAIETLCEWLVQAQTGFNARDAEGIKRILRGESVEDIKPS